MVRRHAQLLSPARGRCCKPQPALRASPAMPWPGSGSAWRLPWRPKCPKGHCQRGCLGCAAAGGMQLARVASALGRRRGAQTNKLLQKGAWPLETLPPHALSAGGETRHAYLNFKWSRSDTMACLAPARWLSWRCARPSGHRILWLFCARPGAASVTAASPRLRWRPRCLAPPQPRTGQQPPTSEWSPLPRASQGRQPMWSRRAWHPRRATGDCLARTQSAAVNIGWLQRSGQPTATVQFGTASHLRTRGAQRGARRQRPSRPSALARPVKLCSGSSPAGWACPRRRDATAGASVPSPQADCSGATSGSSPAPAVAG